MKSLLKIVFMLVAVSFSGTLVAQSPAAQNQTTLKVFITIEKESIKAGPYARFAQTYLGVVAPLADKDIYRVTDAAISLNALAEPSQAGTNSLPGVHSRHAGSGAPMPAGWSRSHANKETTFPKVTIDRMTTDVKSPQVMAADAAKMLFTLRKRRFDLVTGEAGENVYGEGMKAALVEMERMERELLTLFLGKHTVERTYKEVEVTPEAGRLNYVVCRLSDVEGLLPETDLTGRPIVLELRPEGRATAPDGKSKSKGEISYLQVPDYAECLIHDGSKQVTSKRLPILQFGYTQEVVHPKK